MRIVPSEENEVNCLNDNVNRSSVGRIMRSALFYRMTI